MLGASVRRRGRTPRGPAGPVRAVVPHGGRDLVGREEISEFVTSFYREVAQDARLAHYFERLAHVDSGGHVRDLTDFWVGVLLGPPDRDADRVIEAHRCLHDVEPFDADLLHHWLGIFDTVLDDGWCGPGAERARRRAHGYAWAMARRLAAADIGAARSVGR